MQVRFPARRRGPIHGLVAGVLAIGLLTLSACGSSKKSHTTPSASAAPGTVSFKEVEPAANHYAYQGPATITGGTVTFNFTNAGKQPHELQLAHVTGGHTQTELVATLAHLLQGHNVPTPSWLTPAGGVGVIGPGATASATVKLSPGQYYVLDTQSAGQGSNAPPFLTQGAVAPVQVTGTSSNATPPAVTATATVTDRPGDKFKETLTGFKAGTNTLAFNNKSKENHLLAALPLAPGKTPADAKKFLASPGPPSGPPPFANQLPAAATVLNAHSSEVAQLKLQPGNYVVVCFVTDRNGKGKPHFLRGMFVPITVH